MAKSKHADYVGEYVARIDESGIGLTGQLHHHKGSKN
jgi:hypothetical protein